MMQEFKLPDLGEGIHEGEIVDILVSVGDQVNEGQPILNVETDKATVEIPSPFTGFVKEIRVKPGELVKVGTVMMVFSTAKDGEKAGTEKSVPTVIPEETGASAAIPDETEAPTRPAEHSPEAAAPAQPSPPPSGEKGPVPASPATRRLARELGVDLRQVPPSGPAGLVTAEDVRGFAEGAKGAEKMEAPKAPAPPSPAPQPGAEAGPAPEGVPTPERPGVARPATAEAPALPDFERWGPVQREPLKSIRRAVARQMALSWSQVPHVSHQDEADITELEAFRKKHAPAIEARGGRLTLTVFVLKAAVAALKKSPYFNASIDMASEEIVLKRYYNIGVAVDTDRGLIVPVIKDVDRKSITELSMELYELAQRVRTGKASLEEMHGGSFTITNIGAIGGTGFAPIINYPEVAIMGMGMARLKPIVRGDTNRFDITPRLMLPLILAFDHRVVDGAEAARFVRHVMSILESPESLLMAV